MRYMRAMSQLVRTSCCPVGKIDSSGGDAGECNAVFPAIGKAQPDGAALRRTIG